MISLVLAGEEGREGLKTLVEPLNRLVRRAEELPSLVVSSGAIRGDGEN